MIWRSRPSSNASLILCRTLIHVNLSLASIAALRPRSKSSAFDTLTADFAGRASRYVHCTTEKHATEEAFLAWLERQSARTAPVVILLDRAGKQLSSQDFAAYLARLRDSGSQTVVLAIGPPDGWSAHARDRADLLLSFGPITLPHELARVVLAEQVYRALTILAGHPYHSGH
jgi:23S rRNA (pseudouridine1915-N3)-methyltransferase